MSKQDVLKGEQKCGDIHTDNGLMNNIHKNIATV